MNDPLRQQLQTSLGPAYTLERELGGGGMSRVFVARDEALGREIVVKVLAPGLAEGLSAERFARETRLAAALQEPHIVPVLAAGATADGLPWYTMPFVRGESLRARLGRGPVPLPEAIAILRDVARALAHAHAQGVVHRDIKPENVLLSSGTAVVTDFGIAKALSISRTHASDSAAATRGGTLTQLGTSLGTPAYMAPEQAAGDPGVDARADLYAWGVVAYELLAGRHPFAGKTTAHELIAAHFGETPPPLVAPGGVTRPLAALVMRCLAKDPAARPASAAELLEALDGGATTPPAGLRARSRWRAGAAAIALLLSLGGVALAWRARTATAGEPPLVAVLPFQTVGSSADSTFADGLSDAVTGKLAQLAGLRVIDRGSVLAVHDAAASPQATGRLLDAEYVLHAVVRWARGADGAAQVQVTPRLVRVADGTTRWAGEPQVVSPADPFAVQAALATEVAEALDVALGSTERARLARAATRDTAAFAAFERGRLIHNTSTARPMLRYEQALREFERAYTLDPQYADALGWAANMLQLQAQAGASPALFDSAAVLARRALVRDPGQRQAVNALGVFALMQERPADALRVIEQAVRARPSSAELLGLQATALQQMGDTARAWPALSRALTLAPRSAHLMREGFWVALGLRRYEDAADLLARWRELEPENPGVHLRSAILADELGDSAGVARALREHRARGGVLRAGSAAVYLMRRADRALQDELANGSPQTFDAATAEDSAAFYSQKAQLFLGRGDHGRMRPLVDSGYRIVARLAADSSEHHGAAVRYARRRLAWFAAARGDRAEALAALESARASFRLWGAQYPDDYEAAALIATSAEVYGLLGDTEAMLPLLRQAITMPNGPSPAALLTEPAFASYRNDPRFQALARLRPVPVRRPE